MCGIAGIFTANANIKPTDLLLESMTNALRHRGPDSRGIWVAPDLSIGLAHTRLAIQDLSLAGHQPMHSASERYAITFNGEIYNFLHLKAELEKAKIQFKGKSDTEVLLAGIEHWGLTAALQKTEGMFAIALWDKKERVLHLARDRVGEKPLYIAVLNKAIAFASQLGAITTLEYFRKEICDEAVRQFLKFGYIPTPYSIFNNAFKVRPGTFVSIHYNKLSHLTGSTIEYTALCDHFDSTCYWSLTEIAECNSRQIEADLDNNTDILKRLMEETIKDQMISDVPYGAFLSGGIDSSLVVSVMQSISAAPIKTFTIGFENKQFNEATFARQISKHLGTDHHELYVSDRDLLDVIPKLSTIYDEPFADPSQIPTCLVSNMARQQVTVALSGDGGDEFFAGYNRYRMLDLWNKRQRIPAFARNMAIRPALSVLKRLSNQSNNSLIRLFNKNQGPQTNVSALVGKIDNIMRAKSFNAAYEFLHANIDDIDKYLGTQLLPPPPNYFQQQGKLDLFDSMLFWDQLLYLTDDNLVKIDRASMASSLETRHPLLNHRLIEFSWRIPHAHKMTKTDNKLILKRLLGNYLPRDFIERPKMGFSVPIFEWLDGPLREWGQDLLSEQTALENNVLNSNRTSRAWRDFSHQKSRNSPFIWRLIILQDWLSRSKRHSRSTHAPMETFR